LRFYEQRKGGDAFMEATRGFRLNGEPANTPKPAARVQNAETPVSKVVTAMFLAETIYVFCLNGDANTPRSRWRWR
jgi:hypothetical protein